MEETTLLSQPGILITTSRIEINGQTYALRNVGSVKVTRKGAGALSVLVAIVAVAMLFGGSGSATLGAILLLAAAAWIWQGITMRTLVIVTNGGEMAALRSRDSKLIESLRAAIASAIAAR